MTRIVQNSYSSVATASDAARYVGERLRLARKIRNITVQSLASNLGISRVQLQKYENAQTNITISRLWEIANVLNIEPSFFVDGLTSDRPFLTHEDLELIYKLKNIKDKRIRASLSAIIQDLL